MKRFGFLIALCTLLPIDAADAVVLRGGVDAQRYYAQSVTIDWNEWNREYRHRLARTEMDYFGYVNANSWPALRLEVTREGYVKQFVVLRAPSKRNGLSVYREIVSKTIPPKFPDNSRAQSIIFEIGTMRDIPVEYAEPEKY